MQLGWAAVSVSSRLLPAGGGPSGDFSGDRNFDREIFRSFFPLFCLPSIPVSISLLLYSGLWLCAGSWVSCSVVVGFLYGYPGPSFFRAPVAVLLFLQSLCVPR